MYVRFLHNVLSITCSLRGSNMRAMKGNEPPAGNEHHVEDRTLPAQKPARVQRFDETQCRLMLGHKYCLHSCKLHGVAAPGNVPAVHYPGLRSFSFYMCLKGLHTLKSKIQQCTIPILGTPVREDRNWFSIALAFSL
jgi:hypothetical protein